MEPLRLTPSVLDEAAELLTLFLADGIGPMTHALGSLVKQIAGTIDADERVALVQACPADVLTRHLAVMRVPFQRQPTVQWLAKLEKNIAAVPGCAASYCTIVGHVASERAEAMWDLVEEMSVEDLPANDDLLSGLLAEANGPVGAVALATIEEFLWFGAETVPERLLLVAWLSWLRDRFPNELLNAMNDLVGSMVPGWIAAHRLDLDLEPVRRLREDTESVLEAFSVIAECSAEFQSTGLFRVTGAVELTYDELVRKIVTLMVAVSDSHLVTQPDDLPADVEIHSLDEAELFIRRRHAVGLADRALVQLAHIVGPVELEDSLRHVRELAQGLMEGGMECPEAFHALWRLVDGGTRSFADVSLWNEAGPGDAILSTAAFAGQLSFGRDGKGVEQIRSEMVEAEAAFLPADVEPEDPLPRPEPPANRAHINVVPKEVAAPESAQPKPSVAEPRAAIRSDLLVSRAQSAVPGLPDLSARRTESAETDIPTLERAKPTDTVSSDDVVSARGDEASSPESDLTEQPLVPFTGPASDDPAASREERIPTAADEQPDPPSGADEVASVEESGEGSAESGEESSHQPDESSSAIPVVNEALSVEGVANVSQSLLSGRFGSAAVQATFYEVGSPSLYRFAGLAEAVSSGSGVVVGALSDASDEILDDSSHGLVIAANDRGSRALAYLAAVRAALIAPFSSAHVVIAATRNVVPADQFTDAVLGCVQQGVALIDDVLSTAGTLAEAERRLQIAKADAAKFQSDIASRQIKYTKATDVLRVLMSETGAVGELLASAQVEWTDIDARRQAAESVRSKAQRLRPRSVAKDHVQRAQAKKIQIHSGALDRLLAYWDEGLDRAVAWADAVLALDRASRADAGSWQATNMARLRDSQVHDAKQLDDLILDLAKDTDPLVAATGAAAKRLLVSIRSLLEGANPEPLRLPVNAITSVDLLAAPSIRLNGDWKVASELTATAMDELVGSFGIPLGQAIENAMRKRIASEDHVGTELALNYLTAVGWPNAEVLAELDESSVDAARRAIRELWLDTESLLAADRRLGYLDETLWSSWVSDLYSVEPGDRRDLGVVRHRIVEIRERSRSNREAAVERFRQEIASDAADNARVAAAMGRIMDRVDAGDLATAWEYVSLAREGQAIPDPILPAEGIELFYPSLDERLTDSLSLKQRHAALAAKAGGRVEGLDFVRLSESDRTVARDGLDAWRAIGQVARPGKDREWERHLPAVFTMLGMTVRKVERQTITDTKEHDRAWVDLIGLVVAGDPIVPAFAPDPTGNRVQRVLLITGSPELDQLESAVERDRSNESVLVLHQGPLGPQLRARVSEAFRSSGRTVAVLDDNLLAWIAATGPRRYEHTMRTLLPFSTTNPYQADVAGLVPECMFYGRRKELDAILDRNGTCYLYGGRQLGKSALLRHAERRFNSVPNQVAIYIDLKGAQVGMPRPPDAVWEVLWPRLSSAGIVKGDMPAARIADAVSNAIDEWVAEPGRRLLLLLDECDQFVEADTSRELATSARLKNLMERTNRACKIVFAGLHTVQRFSGVQNTPMAHLGTPIAIGPLEGTAAADLITRPLSALGYQFEDPELVNRILAHTSRQPALLVIFCHHLLRRLSRKRRASGEPPTPIRASEVDGTWSDPEVSAALRERVSLTLRLDPAYEVIAYVVAYMSQQPDATALPLTVRDLQEECAYWWPAGFAGMSSEDFRLLADEMIGLGVLAREVNRYGLRNPNIARLLGSPEEIETVLEEADSRTPTAVFEPSTWRREVYDEDDGSSSRSPLSDAQIETIFKLITQGILVTGTRANGLDAVIPTIERVAPPRVKVTVRPWNDPNLDSILKPIGEDRHRVSVVDFRGAKPDGAAAVLTRIGEVLNPATRRASRGTFAIVCVVDAVRDGSLVRAAIERDVLTVVPLRRWSAASIAGFGRDAGHVFAGSSEAGRVEERTGGWGYLVASLADGSHAATTFNNSIERIDASGLPRMLGIDDDPVLAINLRLVATLAGAANDACEPNTLGALLLEDREVVAALQLDALRSGLPLVERGETLIEQLRLADVIIEGPEGVWIEPVVSSVVS